MDLHQRRLLAASQERLAQALFDETTLATDIVTLLEEEALRVQAAMRNNTTWPCNGASALLPQVLADAEARRLQREATGSAVLGVPTGLGQLDNLWAVSAKDCTCWPVPWHGQNHPGAAELLLRPRATSPSWWSPSSMLQRI